MSFHRIELQNSEEPERDFNLKSVQQIIGPVQSFWVR